MMKLVSNIMKSRKVRRSMNEVVKSKREVPCEIWSRVVGYFRPISQWNKGKQDEFQNRKTYDVNQKRDEVEQYGRALALK